MTASLDVIVYGATGYTGRITCAYLAARKGTTEKWGMAGRSAEKLEALKKELKVDVPTFCATVDDPKSLDAVCKSAKVVISCAGPFTLMGMPVVDACVRNGTHYVDATGEFNFVRLVIEKYHEEATKKGLAVVPSCGFDSIPSDMGNYLVHAAAKKPVVSVDSFFAFSAAGVSSGTARSALGIYDAIERKDRNPCSLNPKDAPRPVAAAARRGIWFDMREGHFSCPFLMAAANERIVRRSNALMGRTSSYLEAAEGGLRTVVGNTMFLAALRLLLPIQMLRRWMIKRIPESGSGPSEAKRERSWFRGTFIGTCEGGEKVKVILSDQRDMYVVTGPFLVESAFCIVQQQRENKVKGGVLTPMVAFGDALVERMKGAGLSISTPTSSVESSAAGKKQS